MGNRDKSNILTTQNNIEKNTNYIVYDAGNILPIEENQKHFASLASILSIENGYFGTRSCLEECCCEITTGGTYIAGIYMVNDDLTTDKLAVMPDWTRVCLYIDDNPIDLLSGKVHYHKRYFDIKRCVSVREYKVEDEKNRISIIKTEKFASLNNKHLGGQTISVLPVNYSGTLSIKAGIDGSVVNVDNAEFERIINEDSICLKVNVPEKEFKDGEVNFERTVCMTRTNFIREKNHHLRVENLLPQKYVGHKNNYLFEEYDIKVEAGKEVSLHSLVSIYTNLDTEDPYSESYNQLKRMSFSHCEKAFNDHTKTMDCRLDSSGVYICGDDEAQRYANYSIARLIMAGEHNGEKSSITARTLTGPSYAGHVFWDNEIFDLPYFIYNNPKAAKTMLMYRYNTLDGARRNREIENRDFDKNYRGARFAWESTYSGVERTPMWVTNEKGEKIRIFTGTNEKHITPNIAYATYKYWSVTGDDDFLRKHGAEIIFETARYSASILLEGDDGKLHTKNVIGPDEYHEEVETNPLNGEREGVHDNAYTNMLIKHNIEVAVKTAQYLETNFNADFEKLREKILLMDNEIKDWIKNKSRIYINQNESTGVIEQFEGYHNLKEFDLNYFKQKYGEVNAQKFDQALMVETCTNKNIDSDKNNYKILKQPDVLMLMAMFPEKYSYKEQLANYNYYEPRTSHGSSLSTGIHSLVAARIGNDEHAYKYYLDAGGMDIVDTMGNAANGIHAASLGGTWQTLIKGIGGMQLREKCLYFSPNLPAWWNGLKYNIQWQGQTVGIDVGKEKMTICVTGEKDKCVPISVCGLVIKTLKAGEKCTAVKVMNEWKFDTFETERISPAKEFVKSLVSSMGLSSSK